MSQRIIVCMPMRDKMTEETARALRDNMDGFDVTLLHEIGKPVREARNALVRRVSEMSRPSDTPVLWADDDAWWPVGTIEKLVGSLDSTPNASVIYGMATHRRLPFAQPTTRRADGRLWDLPLRDDGPHGVNPLHGTSSVAARDLGRATRSEGIPAPRGSLHSPSSDPRCCDLANGSSEGHSKGVAIASRILRAICRCIYGRQLIRPEHTRRRWHCVCRFGGYLRAR
jgi:hypothetical protein